MGRIGNQDEKVKIGSDFDGADNFFEGKIDNVMIFDRVLSSDEVGQLAEAGIDNFMYRGRLARSKTSP